MRADADSGGPHGPPHGAGKPERHSGHLCRNGNGARAVQMCIRDRGVWVWYSFRL